MRIGEVCLMTRDVVRLADFYKWLLDADNGSCDAWHQVIIGEETTLAFTVEDVDAEYERLLKKGVEIIDPPAVRPCGMKNMSFFDPDGNRVYFRSALD